MPDDVATRATHFTREHLVWIAVRHFLSADLLEELARAIVGFVTEGRISLDDLFDSTRTTGLPELSSWFAQPRTGEDILHERLQNVVRLLVWTGDEALESDPRGVAPREATLLADISAAFKTAALDLGSVAQSRSTEPAPASLQALIDAVSALEAIADGSDRAVLGSILASAASRLESPLDAVVVKHLGDLCAEADHWQLASATYTYAAELLQREADGAWSGLFRFLRDATEQSRAASRWILEGADAANQAYDALLMRGSPATDPLPLLNAMTDALNARMASKEGLFTSDLRTLVAFAPQLNDTHDLSHALSYWKREKHDAAGRWFWAVLRRQTALGSISASGSTKALFGHSIIDHMRTVLDRQREPASFWLGLRLLIESGDADIVDRIAWPEQLIAEYVDAELVAEVLGHARNAPGVAVQRALVALALLKHWAISLPRNATALAQTMLTVLAQAASDVGETAASGRKIADAALKGLSEVTQARPEFIASAASAVADAVVAHVTKAGIITAGDALRLAIEAIESFDEQLLATLADATLCRLTTFEPERSPWPFVRPAVAFLSSDRVLALCAKDASLRERLPKTVIDFALESESEHASLLYLLRDLDPAWLEGSVDTSRLVEVISELRERAHKTNSSRAPEDVMALLVAPAYSGAEGVRDALEALQAIVQSATGNRPMISFDHAYRPVMLATDTWADIAREARIPEEEVRGTLEKIAASLVEVWEMAGENPLIFAGFAIPRRTVPNAVLVHNWTFASVGLARSLGRELEMAQALGVAARQPLLESVIAIAQATRFAAGDLAPFDVERIRSEKKEPFYTALGRRLLLLAQLPPAVREEVITVLVEQCLRLGPSGLDAGVFTAAAIQDLRDKPSAGELQAYRQRLNNIIELRTSLAPLLEGISRRPEGR